MTRFRPTVESLDARALPSAVITDPGDMTESAAVSEIPVTKTKDDASTNIVVTKDQDCSSTS